MVYASSRQGQSTDQVMEILSRLWQTKLKSITALEKWLTKTVDAEIKAGIQLQLIDERRHLRLLDEEIKRLGGRVTTEMNQIAQPFAVFLAQSNDLYRLNALYRGIKAFTLDRCSHLIPLVDPQLARVLDQISREEQRHIRWAEIRVARLLKSGEARECYLLTERLKRMLESAWSRPRFSLTRRSF
jgi:rubrerythrin